MADSKEKVGLGKRIANWFKATKSEFKKIVWPTPGKVAKDTLIVIVLVVVVGLFISAVQWLFHTGVQFLLPG